MAGRAPENVVGYNGKMLFSQLMTRLPSTSFSRIVEHDQGAHYVKLLSFKPSIIKIWRALS